MKKFTMNINSIDFIVREVEIERPYLMNITIMFVDNNKEKEYSFQMCLN